MKVFRLVSLAASLALHTQAYSIPEPTGPYHVGVTQHVLDHITVDDPFAPNNTGTSILLTIYYPTLQVPNTTRRYLDYELAGLYEAYYGAPAGSLSNITTNLQFQAPTLPASEGTSSLATLVFGPGLGGAPTQGTTGLLSDLASRGYTVVAIDHPYEQPFLQYPYGGPGIFGLPLNHSSGSNFTYFAVTQHIRISDTVAAIEAFPDLVAQYNAPFNTTHYILFGQSYGGSAALASAQALNSKVNILAALNFDGSIFGEPGTNDTYTVITDINTPTLIWAQQGHTNDTTWNAFERVQSKWWTELQVKGTTHQDITDMIFWKQWLGVVPPGPNQIEASRMSAVTRTYVAAFFDMLHGKESLSFEEPSPEWPEVSFPKRSAVDLSL